MPVNGTHPDYDVTLPDWLRARDVLAGEDAVKSAGEKYLPRLDSQILCLPGFSLACRLDNSEGVLYPKSRKSEPQSLKRHRALDLTGSPSGG